MIYFKNGKLLAQHGEARIYELNSTLYLEIGSGHEMWADSDERDWYEKRVYPYSRGDVLEVGLGLGVCSRVILSNLEVKTLTTVEINSDVIKVLEKITNVDDERWTILNEDGHVFLEKKANNSDENKKWDLIFLDTYIRYDEDAKKWLKKTIPLAKKCLKKGGKILFWFDE